MIFIRLLRFLMGYIKFTASGGFPERFINLCTNKGIALWDVKRIGSVLHASTNIKSYKQIREPARKSGMLPRISKKVGLPFFLNRYRRRLGLVIGFGVAIIIMAILSSMIWTVSIVGNENIKTEVLIAALEEAGVKKSVFRRSINQTNVENMILERFHDLSWASLNIFGSRASLEVRERITPPQMFDTNKPCNIVAAHDGEITRLELSSGKAVVEVGSAVLRGDLLVSGVLEGESFTHYVHAKANVFAQTNKKIEALIEKDFIAERVKKESFRYSLYLFGLKIPLGYKTKNYDEYVLNESFVMATETILPLGLIRERFTSLEENKKNLTDSQASLMAYEKFFSKYKVFLEDNELISSDIGLKKSDNQIKVIGNYKLEENIALEKPFEVESHEE